jgi:hypothetical protein
MKKWNQLWRSFDSGDPTKERFSYLSGSTSDTCKECN